MAQSIGNLALILSANSSQFAQGINSAKSSLSLFEQACKATFGAIQAAADRLTFKSMVADIRAMTAAVNELGKAQQSLQRNAVGNMKRWPEDIRTNSPGAAMMIGRARAVQERRTQGQQSFEIPDETRAQRAAQKAQAAGEEIDRLNKKLAAQMGAEAYGALDQPGLRRARAGMSRSERLAAVDESLRASVGDENWRLMSAGVRNDMRRARIAAAKGQGDKTFYMPPPPKLTEADALLMTGLDSPEMMAARQRMAAKRTAETSAQVRARERYVTDQYEDQFLPIRERHLKNLPEDQARLGQYRYPSFASDKNAQLLRDAKKYGGVTADNEKRLRENDSLAMEMANERAFEREKAAGEKREEWHRSMAAGKDAQRLADYASNSAEIQARSMNRAAMEREAGLADRAYRIDEMRRQRSAVISRPRRIAEAAESRADRERAEQRERLTSSGTDRTAVQARWDDRRAWRALEEQDRDRVQSRRADTRAEARGMMDARAAEEALGKPRESLSQLAVQAYIAYHAFNMLRRGLYNVIETSAQFEYQIKRFQVVTRASGPETAASEKQVRDLAKTGIAPHLDLAKAQTRLGLAGLTVEETKQALPTVTKLALMSGEDPALVADSFTVAIRAMGISAADSANVGDVLALANTKSLGTMADMLDSYKFAAPYAKAAGMSLEELAASLAVLSNAGLKGELGGTVMRGMLKKTANQSAEAASQMKRLGISFQDAQGKFIGMGPMLKMLAEQTKDLGELQSLSVFSELFDARAATGVLRLVDQAKQYQAMYEGLQKGKKEGLLGKQVDEMLDTMLMKISRMKAAWMEFKLSAASFAAPAATAAIEKITKVLQGNVGAIAGLGGGMLGGAALGYRFGGVRGGAAGAALGGLLAGTEGMGGLVGGITTALSSALTGAGIASAITALAAKGSMVGAWGGPAGMAAGAALGAAIGGLTLAINAIAEKQKARSDSDKARILGTAPGSDLDADFEQLADKQGVRKRKERIANQLLGLGTQREMMIGGQWTNIESLSDKEVADLRSRAPGKMEKDKAAKAEYEASAFGKFMTGIQASREKFIQAQIEKNDQARADAKRSDKAPSTWDANLARYVPNKIWSQNIKDENSPEGLLRLLGSDFDDKYPGLREILEDRSQTGKHRANLLDRIREMPKGPAKDAAFKFDFKKQMEMESARAAEDSELAKSEKLLGINYGTAKGTESDEDFLKRRRKNVKGEMAKQEQLLGSFKDFAEAMNPLRGLDMFQTKPQTEQEATDQTELQRIFDRNRELNRTLLDQTQAARMAAQGHSELYEAHRAGLPWLDLESAKIRLTGENLGKLAQLELDEDRIRKQIAKGRPGGNYGARLDLLLENKAELERSMRSQAEAAVQGEKQKVWDDTRMPMEKHLMQVQKLDSLVLKAGMDWDTYARGIRKAGGDMDAVNGSMGAWKAGSALEAGSAQAITAQNQSRYGDEVSSGRQSEEHLRLMLLEIQRLNTTLDSMGGAAGFGAAIGKAILGGDGIFK